MSKYTRLTADLEDAWNKGQQRARRGDTRDSFYCLCEHGRWLDAACLAGYDAALDDIRAQRDMLDRVAPRTPPTPPTMTTNHIPEPRNIGRELADALDLNANDITKIVIEPGHHGGHLLLTVTSAADATTHEDNAS